MQGSLKRAAVLALATGASLASAAVLPATASAQEYYGYDQCSHQRSGNTVAGAIIGGIAGAAIGSSSTRCYDRSGYDYDRSYDYNRTYDNRSYSYPSSSYDYNRSYYNSYPSSSYDYNNSYYYGSRQTTPDYYHSTSPSYYYSGDGY